MARQVNPGGLIVDMLSVATTRPFPESNSMML
jgi:hypothetical protein